MAQSSIFQALPVPPGPGGRGPDLSLLMPGDRVRGQVLDVSADGLALIELGAWKVRAKVGFQVSRGQHLELVVVKSGYPLWLKALAANRAVTAENRLAGANGVGRQVAGEVSILAAFLKSGQAEALPAGVAKALARMAGMLSAVEPAGSRSELAARLRDVIENGGHFFETKLAAIAAGRVESRSRIGKMLAGDLKPAIMEAARWLEGQAAGRLLDANARTRLRAVVESVGRRIEGRQKRMLMAAEKHAGGILLDLQIPVAGLKQPVKFGVFFPKRDKRAAGDGHKVAVTLLLELDALGAVRADLRLGKQGLCLDFYLCNQRVADKVQAHLPVLLAGLEKYFDKVECKVCARKQEVERARRRLGPDLEKRIDLLA